MNKNLTTFILKNFVILSLLWGIAIIVRGSLSWFIEQKSFWTAVAELYFIELLLFFFLYYVKNVKWKLLLFGFIILAYTYLHAFFWAFLIGCLYLIFIWITGNILNTYIAKIKQGDFIADILMGMIGIVILSAVCSIFKVATPDKLRIIFLILFLFEIIFYSKKIYNQIVLVKEIIPDRCKNIKLSDSLVVSSIITAFLLQLGKANICLDYDSMWYGLRSSSILAPFGGIYDKVISTGTVYIYGKGFETLTLPFNFETTYSFIYAAQLLFAALCLYVVYKIANMFTSSSKSLFIVLCVSVTPGVMNMAVTAKTDISTLLLELIVIYFVLRFLDNYKSENILYAAGACIFSYAFKATSLVFSSFIGIISVIYILKNRKNIKKGKHTQLSILFLAIIATGMLLYRTFALTGFPVTSLVLGLLSKLGFHSKYPYFFNTEGLVQGNSNGFNLKRIFEFFLYPITKQADHVIIAWSSMLFFVVLVLIICYIGINLKKRKTRQGQDKSKENYLLILLLALFALTIYSINALRQMDGNYFMIFYVIAFLNFSFILEKWKISLSIFSPLIVYSGIFCLLSSWSWSLGLTPINLANYGFYNHGNMKQEQINQKNMDGIYDYIKKENEKEIRRILLYSEGPGDLMLIPGIVEWWSDITVWGRNAGIANNVNDLSKYFDTVKLDYIVFNREELASGTLFKQRLVELAQNGKVCIVMEEGDNLLLSYSEYGKEVDYDLLSKLQQN